MLTRSKFWAGAGSSSESENEALDSAEEVLETTVGVKTGVVAKRTAWAAETSSSEDEKRVVKSARDRHWDGLRETIRQMTNHQKIGDYGELTKAYEALLKGMQKAKSIVEKEGYPKFFIRSLVELEDFIEERHGDKAAVKKLSKAKSMALTALRAKIRKYNEEYIKFIERCREDPKHFDSSESEEESEEEDDSSSSTSSAKEENKEDSSSSSSSYSSGDEVSEDDEVSSVSSGEEHKRRSKFKKKPPKSDGSSGEWSDSAATESGEEEKDQTQGRHERAVAKWGVKKESSSKKKTSVPVSKKKKSKKTQANDDRAAPLTKKDITTLLDGTDLTIDIIRSRIRLLAERRGRKGVNKLQQTAVMVHLAELARNMNGHQPYLEVVGHLVVAEFDSKTGSSNCLNSQCWMTVQKRLFELVDILHSDPALYLVTTVPTEDEEKGKGRDSFAPPPTDAVPENTAETTALGLTGLAERLDDELTKSLQFTDVHSEEYKERLTQSVDLIALLYKVYIFLQDRGQYTHMATMALRLSEQMHYKDNSIATKLWEVVKNRINNDRYSAKLSEPNLLPSQLLGEFVDVVFKYGDERAKIRALLHLAFNKTIHDDFIETQDFLLTSAVQEMVSNSDISTQILYNRALVQLGLCAFRRGDIAQAHTFLADICALNKHKELIAQGLSSLKNPEKSAEQDKEEKRRLLPYHMHISLEMIECAHHICAMLLEVPYMAAASTLVANFETAQKLRKTISRHFRKLLESHDKQSFSGPPENPKEVLMCATKALQKGNWQKCQEYIFSLSVWERVPNAEKVKQTLSNRIKIDAMRTYMFTYGKLYTSFSVTQLASIFELTTNEVHSTVSKMLVTNELLASWDESSTCVLIEKVQATHVQKLCIQLSNSIAQAVDQNEHTFNMKNPKFAASQHRNNYDKDGRDRNYYRGNNRGRGGFLPSRYMTTRGGGGGHRGNYQHRQHKFQSRTYQDRKYYENNNIHHNNYDNNNSNWNNNKTPPSWETRAEGNPNRTTQRHDLNKTQQA